jgi:CheY-like chemotaxis protein
MKHILIIEDEDIIALDLQRKLQKHGYSAVIFKSPNFVIQYVQKERVDLILADISFGTEQDGIDVVEQVNRIQAVPAIFLTAYDEVDIMDRAKSVSTFAYLLKPYDEKELIMSIELAFIRFKYEQDLRFKEQWISSIINSISDGVVVLNMEGHITFANNYAIQKLKLSEQDLSGNKSYATCFSMKDSDRYEFNDQFFSRLISSSSSTFLPDVSFEKDNEALFTCNCNLSPLITSNEQVSGLIISFKTVSSCHKSVDSFLVY